MELTLTLSTSSLPTRLHNERISRIKYGCQKKELIGNFYRASKLYTQMQVLSLLYSTIETVLIEKITLMKSKTSGAGVVS